MTKYQKLMTYRVEWLAFPIEWSAALIHHFSFDGILALIEGNCNA
jgi:hypothetical protein